MRTFYLVRYGKLVRTELPVISVIIPTWNRESFIRTALDSVFAQTYPEERLEIIVVDDGSTDGTREILEGYGQRIYCIYQENRGIASARNAGISGARGDIVTFLDSDDVYISGRIDQVARTFGKNPGSGMVFHPVELIDKDGRTLYRNFNDAFGYDVVPDGWIGEKVFSGRIFCGGSSFAFRKSLIDKIYPIPEDIRIGVDYYTTAIAACYAPASYIPETLGQYRSHAGNITMHEVKNDRGKTAILNNEFAHMRQRALEKMEKIISLHCPGPATADPDLIRRIRAKEIIIYHFLEGRRMDGIRLIPALFRGKKGLQDFFRGIAVSLITVCLPACLYPFLMRAHGLLRRIRAVRF